jgi:hypothetical protein
MLDGGPIYHETHPGHVIVEPWNAISSLLFWVPVIYFLIRLRGHYKEHLFLIVWCSPLLFIGGLGSAIFHAFRSHRFFLFMDFVPIAILTLSVSIYFFLRLMKWWWVVLIMLLTIALRFVLFAFFRGQGAINASYFMTGVLIFLPALLFVIKSRFFSVSLLIWALICFAVALFCRYADGWQHMPLPMGTHWLWHVFSAAGAWLLGAYLVRIEKLRSSLS